MSNLNTKLFIGNKFVDPAEGVSFTLYSSYNGSKVADVAEAGPKDVDAAVDLARQAQPLWEAKPASEKAKILRKFATLVREAGPKLAQLEALSMGKPVGQPMDGEISASTIEYNATLAETINGISSIARPGMVNFTMKQAYGVTAGIIPWNATAIQFCTKVSAALAAGNAIIIKSSERGPLPCPFLCELCVEAGIPSGVVQLLSGRGLTGALLSSHMKIRKVAFTGSTRTGRAVMKAAAESNLKAVTLELGGKSPTIVFDDADVDLAVQQATFSITWNAGQICIANSRIYVQNAIHEAFTSKLAKSFAAFQMGDPFDAQTTMGPVADKAQVAIVQDYIDLGLKEGKAIAGGSKAVNGVFAPTIFSEIAESSRLNKEEIFGPVTIVHRFDTEEEVVKAANDTEYGLYASVFTKDVNRAMRVSKALESGTVGINCTMTILPEMPFGGSKTSGLGREGGPHCLDAWMETKTVFMSVAQP